MIMRLRRRIYSFVLMAIYVIATVCSSASILFCSHHHHHHNEHAAEHAHHNSACSCEGLSFEAECCNHHHSILGENYTDYIASTHRYDDLRSSQSISLMMMPVVVSVLVDELPTLTPIDLSPHQGYESWPLVAAFISHESLRAPPAVA